MGVSASLTATASNGWRFVNWSDGTNTASRKVLVVSNVSLTANFTPSTGFLGIMPTTLAFTNPVTLVSTQAVALTNSGPGIISVTAVTLPAGFSTTPTSFTIASGATRQVSIVFKPTAATTYGGNVKFTCNAARVLNTLTLAGTGIPQTRVIRLAGDLAFGEVLGGLTNTRPLRVCNDGNSPMSITAVAWSNNTGTALKATPATFTVPAGGTSTLSVVFAPKTTTAWNATLVLKVTSLTGGAPAIGVTGSGRLPLVTLAVDPSDEGKWNIQKYQ